MGDTTANARIQLSVSGQQNVLAAFAQLSGFISKVSGALGVLGVTLSAGAIANGLATMAANAIDLADATGKGAQKAGQLTEQFSAMAASAKQDDVSKEQIIKSSKELAKTMVDEGRGAESLHEEFLNLADQMASLPDGAARIELANKRLGKSGQELIPWLSKGSAAIREEMDLAEKMGIIIGPRFAANADQFNDLLGNMKDIVQGFALQLADRLLPEGIKFLTLIRDLVLDSGALKGAVEILVYYYQDFATVIATINGGLLGLSSYLGTFVGAMQSGASMAEAHAQAMEAVDEEGAKLAKRLKEIAALSQHERDVTKDGEAEKKETDEQRIARLKKIFDAERALLDLQIAEKQLKIDEVNSAAEKAGFVSEEQIQQIRTATEEIKKLIDAKLALTKGARKSNIPAAEGTGLGPNPSGAMGDAFLTDEEARALDVKDKGERLKGKAVVDPNSLREQMSAAMKQLRDEAGTMAHQIADLFKNVIGSAIRPISDGITKVVMGTESWAAALRQIGTSILESVVKGIIEMGVRWVLTQVMMFAFGKSLQAAAVTSSAPLAVASSAVWATPAALATIATYGAAALAAPAYIAAAEALTLTESLAAFSEGGYTGAGPKYAPAGIVHRGEWVIPSEAVNTLGHGNMQQIMRGQLPAGGASGGAGASATQVELNTHVFFDKQQMLSELRTSSQMENFIIDVVGRNQHRFRT